MTLDVINLQFKNVNIEGFQSIGTAKINFENLGTCFIKGVNKYDTKTKSNGSGKSSVLLSIYWCLFGKTPAGIGSDVVNKFLQKGCYVELNLNVDGVNYFIRRSQNHKQYKTNVIIIKDNEDISGRNKSDSDKLIKDIIKIDDEIFTQMIFLSQGFANRFAIYGPKARRELLESLYNIDEKVNVFIEQLKTKEMIYKQEINNDSNTSISLIARVHSLESIINKNESNINTTNEQIIELKNTSYNVIKSDVDLLQEKFDTITLQIEKITEKYNNQKIKRNDVRSSLNNLLLQKTNKEEEINKFSNNKICPTCGTVLEDYTKNEHIQSHVEKIKNELVDINANIESLRIQYNNECDIYNKLEQKLESIKKTKFDLKKELDDTLNKYHMDLQRATQIEALINKIDEYNNDIQQYRSESITYRTEYDNIKTKLDIKTNELEILQHAIRLANNQFKSYLLENIINLLNNKLKELSLSLFENEIIQISGDSKLDIVLGEKTYEQLSGGEQRKIDIAIIIAQRFLAQQMNSISSNILILDEVFDGLDDVSFSIVLDLLSDEIQDVESTFIISHRDIKEIPFDNVIVVTKNENQISNIEMS